MICGTVDLLFENTDFESVRAMVGRRIGGLAYIDRGTVIYTDSVSANKNSLRPARKCGASLFLCGEVTERGRPLTASELLSRYEAKGKEAFSALDGDFSLILFDRTSNDIIILVGGCSTLYYIQRQDKLIFSSDKNALPSPTRLLSGEILVI